MLVGLEDEQTVTAELRHEQKSKEAAIACLTIEVQTLTRGNKALAEGIDELHEKLVVPESTLRSRAPSVSDPNRRSFRPIRSVMRQTRR